MITLPISELQEGMICAKPLLTKRGQSIAKEGTVLTGQLIARLSFYKIDSVTVEDPPKPAEPEPVAVPEPEHAPVTEAVAEPDNGPSHIEEHISYSQKLKASPQFQQFQLDYTLNMEYLKENMDAIIAGAGAECVDLLLENTECLFKSKTSIELFDMIHNMRGSDDSVYAHSLNVALISRAIGKWLKLEREDLNTLTVAGLLHDIGKTQIPDEILNKPGRYTDEERSIVESHTSLGRNLLKDKDFDSRVLKAAMQHHERQDGSGYPRHLESEEIDDFASIVAIADVYDAMTAVRSYRNPLCAFQVIAEFQKEGFQKYNTKILLTFLERIAATYQNSRVILSDMRTGQVVYINKRSLSKPVIKLDNGEIVDLSNARNAELFIQAIV